MLQLISHSPNPHSLDFHFPEQYRLSKTDIPAVQSRATLSAETTGDISSRPLIAAPYLLLLALIGLFVIHPLEAQTVPENIPDPSQLEGQFELRLPPASDTSILIPESVRELTAPESDIRFVLNEVRVVGATVFEDSDFLPFYQGLLGQEISIAQAFQMAEEMTALYRNNGYILSRVVLPVQSIVDGSLKLTAVEGFIDQISVEGEGAADMDLIFEMAKKIKASVPLKAEDLERYVLLINDLPGIVARAVLHSSNTQGAANLAIVTEQDKARQFLSTDNRGSKFNGPLQIQFGIEANSLFGDASKTGFRAIGAPDSEFRLVELRHQLQLGSEGTGLSFTARNSLSEPGDSLESLEIESRSNSAVVTLSHPALRSRGKNLFIRTTLDVRDTETDVLGSAFTEDKVRVARIGARFDYIDRFNGINLLDLELSSGLDVLDASQSGDANMSRADARTEFRKLNLSFQRLQRLFPKVSLLLDVGGQYTEDPLFASEEMALGGSTYGRAFDPADVTGERGIAGRLEVRYDGTPESELISRYQTFFYSDYGTLWNRQTDGDYRSESLGSVGAGIRFNFSNKLSAHLEFARPTNSTSGYENQWNDSGRGFFGINFEL